MERLDLTSPGIGKKALARIREIASALEKPDRVLSPLALATRDELVLELSQAGSGRTYTTTFYVDAQGRLRKGKARPAHTASAPGEPPAPDSGELRASVDFEVRDGVAYVGTGLPKGRYLEEGYITAWGTLVAPRPWMGTVVARLPELLGPIAADLVGATIRVTIRQGGQ
jgi:hypothetical protein